MICIYILCTKVYKFYVQDKKARHLFFFFLFRHKNWHFFFFVFCSEFRGWVFFFICLGTILLSYRIFYFYDTWIYLIIWFDFFETTIQKSLIFSVIIELNHWSIIVVEWNNTLTERLKFVVGYIQTSEQLYKLLSDICYISLIQIGIEY